MIVYGIDPGKQGSIARIDTSAPYRARLTLYPMPLDENNEWCPWLMGKLVWEWQLMNADKVIIEQCHAFPGAQAFSSSGVMEAYGMWRMAIASQFTKDKVVIIGAAKWKKDMGITSPVIKAEKIATKKEKDDAYKTRKILAVETAEKEFARPFRTARGRLLDGEAEAALLALWGTR